VFNKHEVASYDHRFFFILMQFIIHNHF